MLKELVDTLKLYKELIAIIVAAVTGATFIVNYFATREALDTAQKKLDALITQRECELSNRIAVAEATIGLTRLDKERLEKQFERRELQANLRNAPVHIRPLLDEQIGKVDARMRELGDEMSVERKAAAEANRVLVKGECGPRKVLAAGSPQ